jgi:hypothetical protein
MVVPVVADDDHGKERTAAADSAQEPVDLAAEHAPHPVALRVRLFLLLSP